MADDNKPIKYLRYAIGEIILVVIGILIALGINNWNNRKNDKEREKDALTEIYLALESDFEQLINYKNRESQIVKIIDSLFLERNQRGTFVNDTLEIYLGKALTSYRPKFITTAYDVLLSSGIGIIKNKDVRYGIAKYYGQDIPDLEKTGNDIHQEWYDEILPIIRKESEHWIYDESLKPYSMDSIFANKELFNILKTFKVNHWDSELNTKGVILENEKIRNKIKPLIEK